MRFSQEKVDRACALTSRTKHLETGKTRNKICQKLDHNHDHGTIVAIRPFAALWPRERDMIGSFCTGSANLAW